MTIIEQLEEADKTLDADGYKQYCYVRIAISEAIKALRQPSVMVISEQLPCSHCGRPLKEHSKDSKRCPDPTNGERFTFEDFKEQIEKEFIKE